MIEECVEGALVIHELIAHEDDEYSFPYWFVFLVVISLQYLFVACCFDLLEKCHAGSFRPFCNE